MSIADVAAHIDAYRALAWLGLRGSYVPVGAPVGTGAWAVAGAGFIGWAITLLRPHGRRAAASA